MNLPTMPYINPPSSAGNAQRVEAFFWAVAVSVFREDLKSCGMDEMVIGRHPGGVGGLARVPMDGTDLIVSGNDEDVCVWDPGSGTLLARSEQRFNGINGMAAGRRSAAGPVIAVASEDTIGWVDALTGGVVAYPIAEDDTYWELAVAEMPDGSRVLFGGAHGAPASLVRWDVDSGRPLRPLGVRGVTSVAVVASSRGPIVFAGGADTVRQWDPGRGGECGPPIVVPDDELIVHIAATELPDGRILLACSTESSLYRWDATTGAALGPPIRPLGYIAEILVEAGRPCLVTADDDGMVRRRDAETGEVVADLVPGHSPVIFRLQGVPMIAAGRPGGVIVARPLTPIP